MTSFLTLLNEEEFPWWRIEELEAPGKTNCAHIISLVGQISCESNNEYFVVGLVGRTMKVMFLLSGS